MKQQTLAMANGFERYTKKTRRTLFLEEMEQVVPWAELCALIEPVYAKAGNGRPPVGAERMLRIYFCSSGSTCRTRASAGSARLTPGKSASAGAEASPPARHDTSSRVRKPTAATESK